VGLPESAGSNPWFSQNLKTCCQALDGYRTCRMPHSRVQDKEVKGLMVARLALPPKAWQPANPYGIAYLSPDQGATATPPWVRSQSTIAQRVRKPRTSQAGRGSQKRAGGTPPGNGCQRTRAPGPTLRHLGACVLVAGPLPRSHISRHTILGDSIRAESPGRD
jgi:hypothetical protein